MQKYLVWQVVDEVNVTEIGTIVLARSVEEAFETYNREVLGSSRHDGQLLRAVCTINAIDAGRG
jgi:hypothetical protein